MNGIITNDPSEFYGVLASNGNAHWGFAFIWQVVYVFYNA